MTRVEKTAFLSYRRTNVGWAMAVYKELTHSGYDVFFDYTGILSGDFESVILENIRARAHFLVILTPSALERCNETGDWLRREIEEAIAYRRNIVPMMFEGFSFGSSGVAAQLTGRLADLKRYNGLPVPAEYFDHAMTKLREIWLNRPLEAVLHPASTLAQKVAHEQQAAADAASVQNEEKSLAAKADSTALTTNQDSHEDQALRSRTADAEHQASGSANATGRANEQLQVRISNQANVAETPLQERGSSAEGDAPSKARVKQFKQEMQAKRVAAESEETHVKEQRQELESQQREKKAATSKQADDLAWRKAQSDDSEDSYALYLKEQPEGDYRHEAERGLVSAREARKNRKAAEQQREQVREGCEREEAKRRAVDEAAWREAKNENTEASYALYLGRQREGAYRKDAESLYLAVKEARRNKEAIEQGEERKRQQRARKKSGPRSNDAFHLRDQFDASAKATPTDEARNTEESKGFKQGATHSKSDQGKKYGVDSIVALLIVLVFHGGLSLFSILVFAYAALGLFESLSRGDLGLAVFLFLGVAGMAWLMVVVLQEFWEQIRLVREK